MTYTVRYSSHAIRQLKKLPKPIQDKISRAINELAFNPYPPGVKKMAAKKELFRIAVATYRIIYHIDSTNIVIDIIEIGHRREVYK